jgi:hypothetical protein
MTEHDPTMAPSDLSWHEQYERVFMRFQNELDALQAHPAFKDAEDLGDYVESITTLHTFRPRSRDDIVRKIQGEIYPELNVE